GKLYQVIKYPAGEIQVRLTAEGLAAADGKNEYEIVANPIPDIIELAQLKDALDGLETLSYTQTQMRRWFYRSLFLPYLPFARADRRFVPGDSFGLAVFARLINSLNFTNVYTFDVHSEAAKVLVDHLTNLDPIYHYDQLTPVIADWGREGLALIAPDKGAANRYDLQIYELPVLTAEKVRDAATGKLSGFKIDEVVKEYKKALIVDDICDGGGTFIGLGEEIHKLNPSIELFLYVSHGIFSQGFVKLNQQFKQIYASDYTYRFPDFIFWKTVGGKS